MKRVLMILTTAVAVATLSGCALFYPNFGTDEKPSDPMNPTPSATESTTESEPEDSPSPTATKAAAKPRLVYYEIDATSKELVVIGEVSNIAESGGSCFVTFFSGGTPIVQVKGMAEENVSTTQCFPIRIPLSSLPKGTGEVVIGYDSDNFAGESARSEVIIP